MSITYKYFYGELVVEKDEEGRIHRFGFWMEEDGDRWEEENLMTDYQAQTGTYHDGYSGEAYNQGQAHTVVLHHDAGTRTYRGLAAWSLEKYHRFLRHLARAQCAEFLQTCCKRLSRTRKLPIDTAFQAKIAYLCTNIEVMQQETQEDLLLSTELYTMVWAFGGVWEADEHKKKLCWSLFQQLEEKWSLAPLGSTLKKLVC